MPANPIQTAVQARSDGIRSYTYSSEKQRELHRRTLIIVAVTQLFGGAGLAAGVTVGALLAQDMLGTDSMAGIPSALITLGSALSAFLVGRLSQRSGRRIGLTAGFWAGGLGALGIVLAAVANSLPLLFVSLLIYGAGTSTNLQARYAGTDLALPNQRARAVSIALVFTTFGAVSGPNLVNAMGRLATSLGIPALAGPFLLAGTAFLVAGLVLFVFLRPDPLLVAKAVSEAQKDGMNAAAASSAQASTVNSRGLAVGVTVMVLTQLVMVAIMTMTPVHMKHHGHGLGEVGLVISIHVCAMFLPSLLTGTLVDKIGRSAMAYASGVTLLLTGILAASIPGDSLPLLILTLALLGLGWNFGLISGTALLIDATPASVRARTQGTVDVLVALSGASGGALSGVVAANSSYAVLSLSGAVLSLLLIPVVIWSRRGAK
ncbi:MFS transporter [Paenibacillus sp. HJGM_3]|uniref:MFS transporter n=1 Tax=Paenibacillus sp. HJGM_3 TaxID=3379816 RepID=UPI00385E1F65